MGESIFEGTLTRWLKKPGDTVKRDEPLFEISTDKIDSEIPAPASGTLQQILVQEGQTVEINTVVGIIGDGSLPKIQWSSFLSQDPLPQRIQVPQSRFAFFVAITYSGTGGENQDTWGCDCRLE